MDTIKKFIESGKPVLGVCLGMQLLMDYSEENEGVSGLGIIPGSVKYFQNMPNFTQGFKVPNIGWSRVYMRESDWSGTVFERTCSDDEFYFVHSLCAVVDKEYQLSTSSYAGVEFASSIKKANVTGCQFHPENSGEAGLEIIKQFAGGVV